MAYYCFMIHLVLSLCTSLSISANGTNKKDVQGLASLQDSFDVLKSWSGDPCLPAPYTWDWIKCNDDPMPRVTALLLSSYGLLGLLPDFSSMTSLQTIDFGNNSLQGPIPEFLGRFPSLKTLNLANNKFNGTIPASLSTKKGLILTVAGISLQLPLPATGAVQFPRRLQLLYPLPPKPRVRSPTRPTPSVEDIADALPYDKIKKSKLPSPRLLKIVIPSGVLCTIGSLIWSIICCRRRKGEAATDSGAAAADSGAAAAANPAVNENDAARLI